MKIGLQLIIFLSALLVACGSAPDPPAQAGAETVLWAKRMIATGHQRVAADELEKLVLNFPDTDWADEAQYLLGTAHMKMREYILAENAFRMLLSSYPGSEYVDDAEFGIALSLSELAPDYRLDQSDTQSAIRAFERFIEDYPSSDLIPAARTELLECRERLARKLLRAARHYLKRHRVKSARIYLEEIRERYPQTQSALQARFYEAECDERAGELRDAAIGLADLLQDLDDDDPLSEKAEAKLSDIRETLEEG